MPSELLEPADHHPPRGKTYRDLMHMVNQYITEVDLCNADKQALRSFLNGKNNN